jgi:hypothetical protein
MTGHLLRQWFSACMVAGLATSAQAQATTARGASPAVHIEALSRHWVQSAEEQRADSTLQVFRPAGSRAFPPSRFRMAYKFAPDGRCEFFFLSPDDAHHFRPCTWKLGAKDRRVLQIAADGRTTSFRIAELSGNVLRIVPLTARREPTDSVERP